MNLEEIVRKIEEAVEFIQGQLSLLANGVDQLTRPSQAVLDYPYPRGLELPPSRGVWVESPDGVGG